MKEYKRFGVMIDCSRNAVMTVSSLKRLIDVLAKTGYNALELYTEDTYEVEGEPYFGYLRGRYTGAELRETDAYAASRGIELIPCIQTLAHFTNPVKLPRFREILDVNDILLIDEEKTYEFIDRLFASLAKNFTSRNVNIGMDEAHMVGLGRYLDLYGYQDRFEILLRHLDRVTAIAQKYGFKPHMWSDMFFRLSGGGYYGGETHIDKKTAEKVPESVALTYWDYYHTDESTYDSMLAAHKEFHREIWFAGGAWTWNGFVPDAAFTLATMKPAMKSVRKNGVENVLVTMWGDNGGECSPFSLLHTLYAIRRYADGEFDDRTIAAEFEKLFGVSYADFDALSLPDVVPGRETVFPENPSKSLLYADPFLGVLDTAAAAAEEIPYAKYAEILGEAGARAGEFSYLFDCEEKLCRVMERKAYLGIRTRAAYRKGDKKELASVAADYAETLSRLKEFYASFKTLWNRERKPFGFEVQDARLGGLMLRLEDCRLRLEEYIAGKTDAIAELEEDVLPLDPQGGKGTLECNSYRFLVSASEI